MLSPEKCPVAGFQPPAVQEVLERNPKKTKRDDRLLDLIVADTLPDFVLETPLDAPMEHPNDNITMPPPGSYRQSLTGFLSRKITEPSPLDEDASDDDEPVENDDPDCPRILVTKEEKKRLRRLWRKTLIIHLLGRPVGYNLLLRRLQTLWKLESSLDLIDLVHGYYLAKFESQNDYDHVKLGGPWMLLDHYLVVQEWEPNFNPTSNITRKLLAWIRLPTLPIEYFEDEFLMKIGRQLGRPIKVDVTTCLASRGKFARVCVEIDISKPLRSKFTLADEVYPVEYEGIHMICFKCGLYGHKQELCGLDGKTPNPPNLPEAAEVAKMETENAQQKTRNTPSPYTDKYGSGMIVKCKERRNPKKPERRPVQDLRTAPDQPRDPDPKPVSHKSRSLPDLHH
ncbi:PREDICTED: uncharacterized protein LOC109157313 [Ipomoea nil]|uniref:uncharacterized protein LOC109157313 n=1 Tax=Ipomoea nil TaxID=35883 RepID=UPI000900DDAA|nr:PREDICTED: uncharacterized protein LOC109157313 [Ipomoea nil]